MLLIGMTAAGPAAGHDGLSHDEPLPPETAVPLTPAPPPAVSAPAAATFSPSDPFSWHDLEPHPVARFEANGLAAFGRLWVLGGFGRWTSQASGRSDVYDPATDTWTRLADIPQPLTHAPAVLEGDRIWLLGGFVGNNPGPSTENVWIYDISEDTWSAGPPLPGSRLGGGGAIVGRTIHFFGGASRAPGTTALIDHDDHWALDLDDPGAGWQALAPLPSVRNHIAGVALDGKVYAVGGQTGNNEDNGNLAVVERYDPATGTWQQAAPLPVPRGHTNASTFVVDGRIVALGGTNNGNLPSAEVTSYDPATDAWTQLTPLPAGRKTPVAGLIDGTLVASTGNNGGGQRDTWVTGSPVEVPAGTYLPSGGTVVIEAEDGQAVDRSSAGWDPGGPAGSVGGAMVVANAGRSWTNLGSVPAFAPELVFPVEFAEAGTYHVWIRANPADAGGDSVHAGLNRGTSTTADDIQANPNGTWQWMTASTGGTNPATMVVAAPGIQTVSVFAREDGLPVDRIVLSTGTTPPTGTGPAETRQAGVPVDETPPSVSATDPEPDATGVAYGSAVTVTFSEPVDPESVTAATASVTPVGGVPLNATRTLDAGGTVLTIDPAVALAPGTTFRVALTAEITDVAGNALRDAPVTWDFSTPEATDTTGPEVQSRAPAPAASAVSVDGDVLVTFSEAVDPGTVSAATVQLTGPGGPVTAARVLSAGDTMLEIDPAAPLAPGALHTVTLGPGLTDVSGNPLQDAPVSWSFTTEAPAADAPWIPQSGTVVMEAEKALVVDRSGTGWDLGGPAGSVAGSMIVPNAGRTWGNIATAPSSAPELRFPVRFPAAGTYRIWVRGYPVNSGGDSLHVGLNSLIPATADHLNNTSYGAWQWIRYSAGGPNPATVMVPSAGVHQVSVYAREDGLAVDRVVLSTGTTAPTGSGPAESPRG